MFISQYFAVEVWTISFKANLVKINIYQTCFFKDTDTYVRTTRPEGLKAEAMRKLGRFWNRGILYASLKKTTRKIRASYFFSISRAHIYFQYLRRSIIYHCKPHFSLYACNLWLNDCLEAQQRSFSIWLITRKQFTSRLIAKCSNPTLITPFTLQLFASMDIIVLLVMRWQLACRTVFEPKAAAATQYSYIFLRKNFHLCLFICRFAISEQLFWD